jgi:hypothetical protein
LHRVYSLQIWSNYASTPQTTVFRFTDLNDLLWFSDLVLGPYTSTSNGRINRECNAHSTAAILQLPAFLTIWRAVVTGRKLETCELSLRVDRCHLLTIQ